MSVYVCVVHAQECVHNTEEDVGVFLCHPLLYCLDTGSLIDLEAHCLGYPGLSGSQDLPVSAFQCWCYQQAQP